jgi:hypothetical protein
MSTESGTSGNSNGLSDQQLDEILQASFNNEAIPEFPPQVDPQVTPPPTPSADANSPPVQANPSNTPADPSSANPANPNPSDAGNSAATKGKDQRNANDDWISSIADADLKAKVAALLDDRNGYAHKYNSDRPRLEQARRTVNDLQNRLQDLERGHSPQNSPSPQQNTPPRANPPAAPNTNNTPSKSTAWNQVAQADATLAEAVEQRALELLEARLSQVVPEVQTQIRDAVTPLQRDRVADYQQRELERLQRDVPQFPQIVQSPEYKEWVEYYAPEPIRRLANQAVSYSDAITVLQNFDYYAMQRWGNQSTNSNQQVTQPPAANTPAIDTSIADRIAQERAANAATAVNPSNTRQVTPVVPNSATKTYTEADLDKILLEAYHGKKTK